VLHCAGAAGRRQIAAYGEAGADELIFQWLALDDLEVCAPSLASR
jgi:hypothetical protein